MAKRLAHSMLLLFLLVGLGQWTTPAAAAQPGRERRPELGQPGQEPPDFVPGRILVQFRPGAPGQVIADAHRQNGGQERATIPRIDVRVVEVPPGRERALAAIYRNNPNVTFAEVDGFYYALSHGSSYPQDSRFDEQWQYRNTGQTGGRRDADIDAYEAWSVTKGSSGVKIAILDSGIDQSHEDLAAKIDDSRNFTDSSSVEDNFGHGTHVAGIAAAVSNNERGVSGT
jgi:thermitase